MKIWLDLSVKYLNFRISEIFLNLDKSIDFIEEVFCKDLVVLDFYTLANLKDIWVI